MSLNETYEIMQADNLVASIGKDGRGTVYNSDLMPYNLYINSEEDFSVDVGINNLNNFYYWCSFRVLSLDRKYAKEILNALNKKQAVTDKDRAEIAISYHCLSLNDVFWVRKQGEHLCFRAINLYENSLSNAFVDVCLRGKNPTLENSKLLVQKEVAGDVSTSGVAPKAWVRKNDGIYLYKDGDEKEVKAELLASKICDCFKCSHVHYQASEYDGELVSESKLITSTERSIVTMEAVEIYCVNHDIDKMKFVTSKDEYGYYMMNIIDYLVGNTDRHWGNWGFWVNNDTNELLYLYPLMDFNKAFNSYDTVEGAGCLPENNVKTQKQAAIEAVEKIGLNQFDKIDESWFYDIAIKEMFFKRLQVLKQVEKKL